MYCDCLLQENTDIYSTSEPQGAFHQRISFCLDIYNQSVKAMRFPPKSYSKNLESFEVSASVNVIEINYTMYILYYIYWDDF